MGQYCALLALILFLTACGAPQVIQPTATLPATAAWTAIPNSTQRLTDTPTPAQTATPTPRPPVEEVIEVLECSNDFDAGGPDIHVTGLLRNISDATICDVKVSIRQYGKYDFLTAWDSAYVDDDCVPPGGTSAFRVVTPRHIATERVVICKIEWQ